jgi:hypothetical protein
MLLAKRFETDLEVESVKLELERDVFDPAKLLGIPAGESACSKSYLFYIY